MARRTGRAPAPAAASSSSSSSHAARRRDTAPGSSSGASSNANANANRPWKPAAPKSIHDVYDFAVAQHSGRGGDRSLRRANAGANDGGNEDTRRGGSKRRRHGGDDSDVEESSDGEEHDAVDRRRQAVPTFGDDDDDDGGEGNAANAIAEEDDSDIESDDAFGASEEERYQGYDFGGGSKAKRSRRASGDDSEDDDGEDDDEDDAGDEDIVDLSKMLDGGEGQAFDSDDSDDDDDSDDSGNDSDSAHSDSSRLNALASSYAQPSASKRSLDDATASAADSKRRRRVLAERFEAMPESEFAAPGSGTAGQSLGIEDLLAPLSSTEAGQLTSLRNNTRALRQAAARSGAANSASQPVASKRGGGALSAPLPSMVKDKMQRSAGYQLSKEEAEKWQPTIKRLREAEHISFPLQGGPSRPKATTAQLAATFKPTNGLESGIDALLRAEGLSEKQISQSEELAMRKMDPEEAKRRRQELRQMRELMFRAEQKAKRTSKIKSKTYRKIARKDKEKERAKLIEAGIVPDDTLDDGGEYDDEARAKAERDRARERATLKHKNTGKWAKAMLGRRGGQEGDDDDTRQAMDEQLQRAEQLRRKIQGRGDDDDSDSDYSGDDGDDGEDGDADPRRAAFNELRALEAREEAEGGDDAPSSGKKGVWNMKFMKDARNRDAAAVEQAREDFKAELRGMGDEGSGSGSDSDDDVAAGPVVGRRTFGTSSAGAGATTRAKERTQPTAVGGGHVDVGVDAGSDSDSGSEAGERTVPTKSSAPASRASRPLSHAHAAHEDAADASSNPWLGGGGGGGGGYSSTRTKAPTLASRSSTAATKSLSKLEKRKSAAADARNEAADDARLEIDPEAMIRSKEGKKAGVVQVQPAPSERARAQSKAIPPAAAPASDSDDDSDSDGDSASAGSEPLDLGSRSARPSRATLSQRDLIAEAFAGDDVTADFAAEKARQVVADAPKEVDTSLPGWGAWGGKGVKSNRKSGAAKRAGAAAAATATATASGKNSKVIPGLAPSSRKDADLQHVIINERTDKKAAKYRATSLPYPYTSAAQYEATLAQPIGGEWNTTTQAQRLSMPRVLGRKPGAVIKPLRRVG